MKGAATVAERDAALAEMNDLTYGNTGPFLSLILGTAIDFAVAALEGRSHACYTLSSNRSEATEHYLATLLRDIFGNPFRPVTLDPSWLTSTVTALAEGIYANRTFDRLPILADALMDAGCDNADILAHCRSEGPHVRGWWPVDLLLGME